MASRITTIDVCDRCAYGKASEATAERLISVDGSYTRLWLCEMHASMFDRDIGGWTRLGEEVDPPSIGRSRSEFFTAERRAETQRLRELAERAAEKRRAEAAAAARLAEIEAAEKARAEALSAEQRRLERAEQALRVQQIKQSVREADLPKDAEPSLEEQRAEQERAAWTLVPNAPGWRLTVHARERMWERGYTPVEVLNAAANPEVTRDSWHDIGMTYRKGLRMHERGDCRVIVNPEKKSVITVMDRNLQSGSYENPTERKAQ